MRVNKFLVFVSSFFVLAIMGCNKVEPRKVVKAPATPVAVSITPVAESTNQPVETVALPADVLAKVGDWTITSDEFNQRIKVVKESVKDFNEKEPGAKAMLLNELVRQQLLIQQARKDQLDSSSTVKTAMKEFENTLLVQESVTQITKDVVIGDEEVTKYYNENPNEFKKPKEKHLREIVVATKADANAILVQILQGSDFAQLAKDKSKGKTAADGGVVALNAEVAVPAMAAAVANLNAGDVSSVFEGPDGFYIVKVETVQGGDTVALAEIKADLMSFLKLRKQQELLQARVKDIQKAIKVQVNESLLKE